MFCLELTHGAASPTAPAASSSWRTWLLLPVTQGLIPPPIACQPSQSHSQHSSAGSCRWAPSAVLSPLCAHSAACGNAPATHNPSCSPTAVAQTLAYFTLQEQEEAMALLLSCSFSRLALALCTLQGVGPAKPLTAMQGQSLPPP